MPGLLVGESDMGILISAGSLSCVTVVYYGSDTKCTSI